MRIGVAAVGRIRGSPCAALVDDYLRRLPWAVEVREIDIRHRLASARLRQREGALLLAATRPQARLIALDPGGRMFDSRGFAGLIGDCGRDGVADLAFLIGGADGLDDAVRRRADLLVSFGPMTWPHLLARAMLAEQLYRAHTILAGHPYHRE